MGAVQQAAIPLRRVIYWEQALADPARYVDFVVAVDGDPVAVGVQKQALVPVAIIHTTGQPHATIYQVRRDGTHLRYPAGSE